MGICANVLAPPRRILPPKKAIEGARGEGGGGRDKWARNCRTQNAWEPARGALFQSSFRFSFSQLVINFASVFKLLLIKNVLSKKPHAHNSFHLPNMYRAPFSWIYVCATESDRHECIELQ